MRVALPASLTKRSHASLVRAVLVACNRLPGVDLYAVDVGGAKRKHGTPGVSDIIGYVSVCSLCWIFKKVRRGKACFDSALTLPVFVAYEIKVGRDKLRPAQRAFLERVNAAGGIGLEIRDVMSAVKALGG